MNLKSEQPAAATIPAKRPDQSGNAFAVVLNAESQFTAPSTWCSVARAVISGEPERDAGDGTGARLGSRD